MAPAAIREECRDSRPGPGETQPSLSGEGLNPTLPMQFVVLDCFPLSYFSPLILYHPGRLATFDPNSHVGVSGIASQRTTACAWPFHSATNLLASRHISPRPSG